MSIATLIATYSSTATQRVASALCIGGATLQAGSIGAQKLGQVIERDSSHHTLGKVVEMAGRILQSFTTYLLVGPFTATAFEGLIGSIVVFHPLILKAADHYAPNHHQKKQVEKTDKLLNTITKIFNIVAIIILAAVAKPTLELGVALGAGALLALELRKYLDKHPQIILGFRI